MQSKVFPRAFAIDWEELLRWNVSFFQVGLWDWPDELIRPLGDFAQLESVPIDAGQAEAQDLPIIAKINFGGELFLRSHEDYRKYKGKLFLVQPDRFIFSKINARQGCIFHADEAQPPFVVSSEYPVLRLDPTLALGDYVDLALRVGPAREQLQGGAVGMAKPRTSAEDFLRIQIPLPPLWVQAEIVARQRQAQADARLNREQLAALEVQAELDFLGALGLVKPLQLAMERCFAVEWKDLERWSVSFLARLSANLRNLEGSRYAIEHLGDVAHVSYGIQKFPGNRPGRNARPYLRVANVQANRLDLREVKTIEVPDCEMELYRLKRGDLLVCEGNSADLVGRPAIWNDEILDCVHQNHVLRVRVHPEKLLPEFALEWMQTQVTRNYFRSRAKFTTNLASINSSDLRELPLPLPPLPIQREIMRRAARTRNHRAVARTGRATRPTQPRRNRGADFRRAEVVNLFLCLYSLCPNCARARRGRALCRSQSTKPKFGAAPSNRSKKTNRSMCFCRIAIWMRLTFCV